MSRIASCFEKLRSKGTKALIPYITAGDPSLDVTLSLAHAVVAAGANIIELGVPFSDPMADGPVIQRASERALAHGASLRDVLAVVAEFRKTDNNTPIVLMGYLNPIEVMGYKNFAREAASAGVDGVLTVDLPPEEAKDLLAELVPWAMDPIFLIAPTTNVERIQSICRVASGYLYYVSFKGITGASHLDVASVTAKVQEIRQHTDLAIGVGFGIKDPNSAAAVAEIADAVIVGSALIQRIEQHLGKTDTILQEVSELVTSMRRAMDKELI